MIDVDRLSYVFFDKSFLCQNRLYWLHLVDQTRLWQIPSLPRIMTYQMYNAFLLELCRTSLCPYCYGIKSEDFLTVYVVTYVITLPSLTWNVFSYATVNRPTKSNTISEMLWRLGRSAKPQLHLFRIFLCLCRYSNANSAHLCVLITSRSIVSHCFML